MEYIPFYTAVARFHVPSYFQVILDGSGICFYEGKHRWYDAQGANSMFKGRAIFGTSSRLLLLLLAMILAGHRVTSATIYLGPDGQPWPGQCTDSVCTVGNACTFSGARDISTSLQCDFFFLPGDYTGQSFNITLPRGEITVTIGNGTVVGHRFAFFKHNWFRLKGDTYLSSIKSSFLQLNATEVTMQNIVSENSPILVTNTPTLDFLDTRLIWSNPSGVPISWSTGPTLVGFRRCQIIADKSLLIDASNLTALEIVDSNVVVASLVRNQEATSLLVSIRSSTVFFSSPLLCEVNNTPSENFTVALDHSKIECTTKNSISSLSNIDATVHVIRGSDLFSVSVLSSKLTAMDSLFQDCDVIALDRLTISRSTFKIASALARLIVASPNNATVSITLLKVEVEPSQFSRKPFQIGGQKSFDYKVYSISTNALWIDRDFELDYLSVSTWIGRTGTGSTPTLSSSTTPENWTFGSVAVQSVIVNLASLEKLDYVMDNPVVGAIGYPAGIRNEMLPKAILPKKVAVLPSNASFITGTWYPLFANYFGSVPPINFTGIVGDTSIYEMWTKTENEGFYFRRLPKGWVTPGKPSTCPLIPITGFICIDGVLVSVGSIDSSAVALPPGTIIVIGNVTSASPITFPNVNSNLNVTGCLNSPGIVIDLENEVDPSKQASTTSFALVSQGKHCLNSLQTTPVSLKQSKKSCKKVKVKVDATQSSSTTLSVLFTIDESACNVKWIILGTVLGGVLLTMVALVGVFTFSKRARECARPFSKKRDA